MAKGLLLSCLVVLSSAAYAGEFTLSSTDITGAKLPLQQVFNSMNCTGGNISPQLSWHAAPAGTQSYAITAYDPDAPTGSGWWHWTVFNIPASVTSLATGASTTDGGLPAGAIQGRTDFGSAVFGGACPPVGDKPHHYQFTVWALKVDHLPLDANASGALVGYMIHGSALAKAQISATYQRK